MQDKILVTKSSMPPYEEYIEMIKPLWESRWITNMGECHKQLEQKLQDFLQVPYISLMVNGHLALEMAIQAMGFPQGGEVITTPFTFISTTHAIIRNGLKPVFCDIKLGDYTIDESKIESLITKKTVAIVPVHVYGNICNVKEIRRIARKYDLKVIYDAAHAFGETFHDNGIAVFGDATTFSFHATKVFNTIEGGAVASNNIDLYEKLYNLKNFGIRGEESIVEVGANAKMNEFSAAMGLCNLKYVENNIEERRRKVELYINELKDMREIVLPQYNQEGVTYNYAYFPVRFLKEGKRNEIYHILKENGICARKYFYPLTSDADCFSSQYENFSLPNAKEVANNILVLPLYPDLQDENVVRICNYIKRNIR